MARSGKKAILLDISRPEHLEDVSEFIKRKKKGLTVGFDYSFDKGLTLTVNGPQDQITLFEHQIREFVNELIAQQNAGYVNDEDEVYEKDDGEFDVYDEEDEYDEDDE